MSKEFRTKTFKSGNSVAIRLPKALGLVEGEEMMLVPHADGSISFWKDNERKRVFMALRGSMSHGFMADGRDDSEQPERDWTGAAEAKAA